MTAAALPPSCHAPSSAAPPVSTSTLRALIVDDREDNRYLLRMLLQGHGFTVQEASNGVQALTYARQQCPDVVVSDLLMPVMDGYTLLRQWKGDTVLSRIPFVVYTATYTTARDEQLARDLGADEFLLKPAEPEAFMDKVWAVLARAHECNQEPRQPHIGEQESYQLYNAVLIHKLEQRTQELERRIVQLHQVLEQLTESETASRLYCRAMDASANGIVIAQLRDAHLYMQYVNVAFSRITGYDSAQVQGQNMAMLFSRIQHMQSPAALSGLSDAVLARRPAVALVQYQRPDGGWLWIELSLSPVPDALGSITHYIAVFRDVSERKRYEEQLERQNNQDALTGLASRHLLRERAELAMAFAQRQTRMVAVCFIDLDHFSRINDGLGHPVGDAVLQALAQRWQSCVRERDTLARLGGDDFVAVLADMSNPEEVALRADMLAQQVAQPLQLNGHEISLSASIGVSLYPQDGTDFDTLLRHADAAMYRAKDSGRNALHFFTADMNGLALQRLELEAQLRQALAAGELVLHYQPLLSLHNERITDVEALIRWQRPDGSMRAPAEFIGLAEDTGLIVPIGRWVLRHACEQALAWQAQGVRLRVAVNLSARQFRDPQLLQSITEILTDTGLQPCWLKLEITESAVMDNPEAATRTLMALRGLGLGVSMDDFGTGYSSLAYLQRFPIDQIKIDRSFVQATDSDADSAAIVRSIVDLARALRLQTVAEGVETPAQRQFLHACGCDLVQGYGFSRPLAAPALLAFVLQHQGQGQG